MQEEHQITYYKPPNILIGFFLNFSSYALTNTFNVHSTVETMYPISPPERKLMVDIWRKLINMSCNFCGSPARKIMRGLLVGNVKREVV